MYIQSYSKIYAQFGHSKLQNTKMKLEKIIQQTNNKKPNPNTSFSQINC